MCVTSSLALTLSLITVWNCYIPCLFGEWDLSHSQGPEIGEIYSSVWLCFAIAVCVWGHLSGRHNSPTTYTHQVDSPRTLACLASGHREKKYLFHIILYLQQWILAQQCVQCDYEEYPVPDSIYYGQILSPALLIGFWVLQYTGGHTIYENKYPQSCTLDLVIYVWCIGH